MKLHVRSGVLSWRECGSPWTAIAISQVGSLCVAISWHRKDEKRPLGGHRILVGPENRISRALTWSIALLSAVLQRAGGHPLSDWLRGRLRTTESHERQPVGKRVAETRWTSRRNNGKGGPGAFPWIPDRRR